MCGLLVQAGSEREAAVGGAGGADGWETAMQRLGRRGPDSGATWRSRCGRVRLGHTRLAINDLSDAGAQPMVHGRVALVFNGEIYNAPALREQLESHGARFSSRSDTEVLLHGYEAWGLPELLERIIGMYAFVIWDGETGELCGAVDPAGMKPLVYSCTGGRFYAASDCDSLRLILPSAPALDGTGLCHVLCLGYCPAPWTVWQGVRKLGPGRAFRWRAGEASPRIWRYWSPPTEIDGTDEGFDELFESVVGEHLLSDVPIGLFLSGGLDSSAVALALSRLGRSIQCLTLGLEGEHDESAAAEATAVALDHPHRTARLEADDLDGLMHRYADAYDEPQGFGALLTATRICEAARQRSKVMLAGDGGDEAFAGYTWHASEPRSAAPATDLDTLDQRVARADADGRTRVAALESLAGLSFTHAYLQSVMPRFHPAEAAAMLAPIGAEYDARVYAGWAREYDEPTLPWPRRAQRIDLGTFCAGSILPKMDRASMAVGLELRMPFLDRRVIEWALTREPVRSEASKPTLRRYLRGRVPAGVLERPKQGFSLRVGGPSTWTDRLASVGQTKFGAKVLVKDWAGFVGPDAPNRAGRAHMLCMVAAWAEERI